MVLPRKSVYYGLIIITFLLSAFLEFIHQPLLLFVMDSIAVIFTASLLGKATESIAYYAGDRLGGFLNATFGNAAELIIAVFLVKDGLLDVVKASITGSIIGNLLLVLGLSVLLGGIRHKQQRFNHMLASHNASLMTIAVIALFVPAVFMANLGLPQIELLSIVIASLLIITYMLWLFFSMVTHRGELSDTGQNDRHEKPEWGMWTSLVLLVAATVLVAFESEWLVGSIEIVASALGWSEIFVGAFVVAIVGNAAEHSAAVMLAMKNKIGAAVEIAVGSSLQIALFVAPVLVFISLILQQPMNLVFTTIELTAIGVSAFIAKSISFDGATNWYEGVLLLVVYIILGTAFYFA